MPLVNREKEKRVTADAVRSVLDYDPQTGIFRWKNPNSKRLKAGDIAGSKRSDGRNLIRIGYDRFLASRLAWLYVYGHWPERLIDHADRDQSNDAISNLRLATDQQNHWNSGVRRNKQLGHRNIVKHKKRFAVRFFQSGKAVYRASFATLDEAIAARDAQYPLIFGAFAPINPDFVGGHSG